MRRRAGFTLIELTVVVGVIGILAALAVPNYAVYLERARDTEAAINLAAIGFLERLRILEAGAPIACPAVPAEVPDDKGAEFVPTAEWKDLGFEAVGKVRFQYEVRRGEGLGYEAIARRAGRSGERTSYRLDGRTMEIQRVAKEP